MSVDLYKIYKGFYQRSYRDKYDDDYAVMTELVHDLVRNLYRNQYNTEALEKHRIEGIEIAQKVYQMEKEKPGLGRWYSISLIKALKSKDYDIEVPYRIIPLWLEDNYFGSLYVLTSNARPDQCKLGATYMDVDTRVSKYISKYGYNVSLYFHEVNIMNPFNHELEISNKYSHLRHSGNTYGDSNEWYYVDPEIFKNEILKIV